MNNKSIIILITKVTSVRNANYHLMEQTHLNDTKIHWLSCMCAMCELVNSVFIIGWVWKVLWPLWVDFVVRGWPPHRPKQRRSVVHLWGRVADRLVVPNGWRVAAEVLSWCTHAATVQPLPLSSNSTENATLKADMHTWMTDLHCCWVTSLEVVL